MSSRELRQLCEGKLSTEIVPKTKRDVFVPHCEGEPIHLMHAISLSRAKGRDKSNEKIVAEALFMSKTELVDAKNCGIGPGAAYLGMCVRLLSRVNVFVMADPITFPARHPLLALVSPLLKIADRERNVKPGRHDNRFLGKLAEEIDRLRTHAKGELLACINKVAATIASHISK